MRKSFTSAGLAALLLATTAVAIVAPNVRATTTQTLDSERDVVLIAQNEELDVYDPGRGLWAAPLVENTDWVNGTPCVIPNADGTPSHRFLEADDDPNDLFNGTNGEDTPFFGLFDNAGKRVSTDESHQAIGLDGRVGVGTGMLDPAGCTFDGNRNFFGVDVGKSHTPEDLDGETPGKLVEFFAPDYNVACLIDPGLSQPGMPAFKDGTLYVPETGAGTIQAYTGLPDDRSDCVDGTPVTPPAKAPFATAATDGIGTPSAIVRLPDGSGWAVSSVLAPSGIFAVSDQGVNMGPLVAPGPDTGTPFGFGFVGENHDVYYADLGVQVLPDPTDPSTPADAVDGHGGLRWAKGGTPLARPLVTGWDFPDGVAIVKASWIDNYEERQQDLVNCDWATFGHDIARSFAAPGACSSIDAGNVDTLTQKWHVLTNAPVTAQPVVKDGVLYVGASDGTFYAIDAATGVPKWTYTVDDPNKADYGVITSSAAVAKVGDSNVIVFAGAASLYVLDTDGNLIAGACLDPEHAGDDGPCTVAHTVPPGDDPKTIEIESSPAIAPQGSDDAWIYVGMDYNESPGIGPAGLVKFDLKSTSSTDNPYVFEAKWKYDPETETTYAVDPLGPQTGAPAKGCGNVWTSPAVRVTNPDTNKGIVVFGVGNCDEGTQQPDGTRSPTQESITALDYADGSLKFVYKPHHDFSAAPNRCPQSTLESLGSDSPGPQPCDPDVDFGATPNLLLDDQVGEGSKDGHYYSLSLKTPFNPLGTLKWEAHAAMPSDLGGMIGSTAVGMSRGRPAVFASSALPFSTRDPLAGIAEGLTNLGDGLANGTVRVPPGGLHAFRAPGSNDKNDEGKPPATDPGTAIWDAAALPAYGAAVYVGNLVFVPDTFGFQMQAYDADTGKLVWTLPTVGPPASPPSFLGDTMYFGSGIPQDGSPISNVGGIWAFSLPSMG